MKRIVFCDFDGTITTQDTFVKMMREFAPECARDLLPEIYALRLSLRDGIRQTLESIPSRRYGEILDFIRPEPRRSGFVEFLDFLDARNVPIVVVSGGLRGMVETVLGDVRSRILAIHAVEADTRGEYLRISSQFEGGTELVAKVKAIEHYAPEQAVAIGDSVTDLNMALHAPIVFARERLADYLEARDRPYFPWNDFFDIRDRLQQLWEI
ncbi:HAD-IB family phosphatase [Oxynema aestuarii]|uniref:HAD-IB family phosphatase n=1 Tax=Oxynema aestuarii AP17 TaxID=2064643 RepID=A0A6H1TTC1_9CYAN|nr:HAD-IB family phosphatase [Oxynema aestuarii]QIZ69791.1 HAD-IB family phosphatase [Oxynema aestuarii AP17]